MRNILIASMVCGLTLNAAAMFMRPDVEKVPVDRLIANVEAQLAKEPGNLQTRYALGRLHAMAFWRGAFEAELNRRNNQPWFGYCDQFQIEGKRVTVGDGSGTTAAKDHLDKAIELLREVVKREPKQVVAQLGLGWCVEQSGDKKGALAEYRKALDLAWKKEEPQGGIGPCGSVTEEVCRYLLPLLDGINDAAEIERIKGIQKKMKEMPRAITPILLPLGRETALERLIAPEARVNFDLDGSGEKRAWQWITPEAGWLVYDHDGKGEITSGLQMFGAVSFWIFWENGYQALGALDNDADGAVAGEELRGLALWRDANGNGVSEPGEVKPLAGHGIRELRYDFLRHATGIPYHPQGVFFTDGTSRPTYDWTARTAP